MSGSNAVASLVFMGNAKDLVAATVTGKDALQNLSKGARSAADDIGSSTKIIDGEFEVLKESITKNTKESKESIGKLPDSAREALDRMKSVLGGAAKTTAVLGVAAGAAFAAGLNDAMDIQQANAKLTASLNLSASESKKYGDLAGKLYADAYGDSVGEVTESIEAVISSIGGLRNAPIADVEAVTTKVLDLSNAFEMDVGRSAQIAGQLITTKLARDGTNAIDLLTVGLQKVPKAVREDLIDALDEYSPFFQTLGLTGEQSIQLLVNASKKGMYGIDKLGDSLKEFTLLSTDMSTASKAGYDAIGLSQKDMADAILAGGDKANAAFGKIITGLRGIKDPSQQSQAALALFGTPLEDLSVSEIPKFLSMLDATKVNLGQVDGASAKMGKSLNDNINTNLSSLFRTAKMVFIDFISQKVIPIVSGLVSFLQAALGPAISFVAGIIRDHILPPLRDLFGWINKNKDTIATWIEVIGAFLAPFIAFKVATIAISVAQKAWATIMGLVTAAQWALNVAMEANPILLIVGLIAGLVAAFVVLWNKSAGFRNFFIGIWEDIKRQVGAVVDWVVGAWNGVIDFFSKLPGKIGGFFSDLGTGIKNVFKGVVNGAIDLLNKGIGMINGLIHGVNKVTGWIGIPAIPDIPKIPRLHTGGVVPGMPGEEVPIIARAGEHVSVSGQGPGSGFEFLGNTDTAVAKLIMELIRTGKIRIV